MNDKKLLSEIDFDEAVKLHKNNKWLQDKVYNYFITCLNYDLDEVARHFDKVKHIRYEFGNIYGDYIKVNQADYGDFLEAVKVLDTNFCIFSDSFNYDKFERMINKFDFFLDCVLGYTDISDKQFEKLEQWFESGIEETKKAVLDYVDGLTDYDEEYYLESYLENYGEEYATDGVYIYELTVRKHA